MLYLQSSAVMSEILHFLQLCRALCLLSSVGMGLMKIAACSKIFIGLTWKLVNPIALRMAKTP